MAARTSLLHRLWDIAGAVSIRVKVLGIVLGVIALLSFLVTLQVRRILLETLTEQLEQQGNNISENILEHAAPLLAQDDPQPLQNYLAEMHSHYSNASHNTEVRYIYITDMQQQVLAHTFAGEPPHPLPGGAALPPVPPAEHGHSVQQYHDQQLMDVATTNGDLVLHLGLSEAGIQRDVNSMVWQIIYITGLMLLIGTAAAVFLTWVLTRPILNLVDATEAIARGEFSRRINRWANDEIGALAESFNMMAAALEVADRERQQQEALRDQYISGVIMAQEEERKRIARELHDSTSQSLTSLLVGLRSLEEVNEPAQLQAQLADLRQVVSATLEEVHMISRQLRPSALDDLGLQAALQRYVNEMQARYRLALDLVMLRIERLPSGLETTVYRIVQEALTNIVRHAQASTASILIEQREGLLRIIVEDNGIGFDPEAVKQKRQSLGLQGIRERASLFNGKMTIESTAGQGSSLFVEIPIQEESTHHGG